MLLRQNIEIRHRSLEPQWLLTPTFGSVVGNYFKVFSQRKSPLTVRPTVDDELNQILSDYLTDMKYYFVNPGILFLQITDGQVS